MEKMIEFITANWAVIAPTAAGIIGHFIINKKWTSVLLWLEKATYFAWKFLSWFNTNTNKGQK